MNHKTKCCTSKLTSASGREDLDFRFQTGAEPIAFNLQIMPGLQVEPELFGRPEESREAERGVGGDGARAVHNFVDAPRRHTEAVR